MLEHAVTMSSPSVCVVVTNDDGLAAAASALSAPDRCDVVRCRYVGLSDSIQAFATHAIVDARHVAPSDVAAILRSMPVVSSSHYDGVLELVRTVVAQHRTL